MAKNRFSKTLVTTITDEQIAETLGIPIEDVTLERVIEFGDTHVKQTFIDEVEMRLQAGPLTIMREI